MLSSPLSLGCVDTGHPAQSGFDCRIQRPQLSQFLFPPQPFYSIFWSHKSRLPLRQTQPPQPRSDAARSRSIMPRQVITALLHGGNVGATEAVLSPQISPLHPGLLTASLLRSRRPNSGHGRQEFLVPLYQRRYSDVFAPLQRDGPLILGYVRARNCLALSFVAYSRWEKQRSKHFTAYPRNGHGSQPETSFKTAALPGVSCVNERLLKWFNVAASLKAKGINSARSVQPVSQLSCLCVRLFSVCLLHMSPHR